MALFCALSLLHMPVQAQLTEPDRSRLISSIEAARQEIDVNRFPNLEAAKSDILAKIAAVHRYFEDHTDPENREAWLRYLNMQPLADAIDDGASIAVLNRERLALHERLLGMTPGLELTALRNLRSSTEELFNALLFRDPEKAKRYVEGKLKEMAAQIKEIGAYPSSDQFALLTTLLSEIDASGQSRPMVEAFRTTFDRPNLAILVGKPLVTKAISRDVKRARPVRDCILGTSIFGNASLEGAVTARLIPSIGNAKVQLLFRGQVESHNRGYNKPVRLRMVGNGDVRISRLMTVAADGTEYAPAETEVALSTKIQCIEHPLSLVRKLAWKTARRQKSEADRIATERMRVQLQSEFEAETGRVSPMTPTDLLNRATPTLRRLALSQPTQSWSSTEQSIAIDSVFRGDDQLASIVSRPEISETFDAAIQIHESAIENALTTVLAGRTLNEKRLNELLGKIRSDDDELAEENTQTEQSQLDSKDTAGGHEGNNVPAEEEVSDDESPFEIAFHRVRPIIFEARDQTLRLGIRGTRFAQGKKVMNRPLEITAVYVTNSLKSGAIVLQRQGQVKVTFPGQTKLRLQETAIRPVIEKSFSKIFPQTLLNRTLKVPSDAKIESLRGTEYRPNLIDADEGWLTIAIR